MAISKKTAATIIAVDLFKRTVEGLETTLNGDGFRNWVRYHADDINAGLKADFKELSGVLQATVDKFFWGYYEVNTFMSFSNDNFKVALAHNLEIISGAKKLAKFIS